MNGAANGVVNGAAATQSPAGRRRECQREWGVGTIKPRWDYRAGADELAPGQIHLWVVGLEPIQPATRMALLTAPELARAERYIDRAQRARYLGGRIGLRRLLRAYSGIANDDLRFGYGTRGKPSLRNQLPGGELCFNYTLSGNRALYAVAWNRQVGIDLETWPRKINAALLAKRKLAAVERRAWHTVPAQWRDRAMLACWTRKEAYGKALGVGIRYRINQAPVFVEIDSPTWQCRVSGLFGAQPEQRPGNPELRPEPGPEPRPDPRILHGIQLALPFPGVAALVYDGDALASPADGESLQAWQLSAAQPTPITRPRPVNAL